MQGGKHTAKAITAMMRVTLAMQPLLKRTGLKALSAESTATYHGHRTEVFSNLSQVGQFFHPRQPRNAENTDGKSISSCRRRGLHT